jgi:hypothetical protein
MVNKAKVASFVATQQPDKAKAFYEKVLRVRLVADGPYAIVFDANGTMLRIQNAEEVRPHPTPTWGGRSETSRNSSQSERSRVKFEVFGFLPPAPSGRRRCLSASGQSFGHGRSTTPIASASSKAGAAVAQVLTRTRCRRT